MLGRNAQVIESNLTLATKNHLDELAALTAAGIIKWRQVRLDGAQWTMYVARHRGVLMHMNAPVRVNNYGGRCTLHMRSGLIVRRWTTVRQSVEKLGRTIEDSITARIRADYAAQQQGDERSSARVLGRML